MKKCPICHRSFSDPTLNFCLDDGATLIAQTGNFGQAGQNPAPFEHFGQPKKSKQWIWILGVLGVIVLIGAGSIIGLIAFIAASGNSNNGKRPVNKSNSTNGGSSPANSKTPNNGGNNSIVKNSENVDFTRWGERKTAAGETKLVGDEFQVNAHKNGFYYVVIASNKFDDKYLTNNSVTKVTTHSVTGNSPTLGYGLIINSDVDPLKSDYAFLIRSDNQTYRVVSHEDDQEGSVVNWTYAPQIRTGTQTNQLEVRSVGTKLSFYINGQLATTVTDESGSDQGIVGLYTSDSYPIGFSDLQIIKN